MDDAKVIERVRDNALGELLEGWSYRRILDAALDLEMTPEDFVVESSMEALSGYSDHVVETCVELAVEHWHRVKNATHAGRVLLEVEGSDRDIYQEPLYAKEHFARGDDMWLLYKDGSVLHVTDDNIEEKTRTQYLRAERWR